MFACIFLPFVGLEPFYAFQSNQNYPSSMSVITQLGFHVHKQLNTPTNFLSTKQTEKILPFYLFTVAVVSK
jgi:hypothetical protein